MRAISLNYLISSAPGTLGIKDKIPKFKREMSIRPRAKPLSIWRIKGFTRLQKDLKKITGKPSGPGAVSVLVSLSTRSSSSGRNDLIKESLSSWEAH
jgi:hypothetical protein